MYLLVSLFHKAQLETTPFKTLTYFADAPATAARDTSRESHQQSSHRAGQSDTWRHAQPQPEAGHTQTAQSLSQAEQQPRASLRTAQRITSTTKLVRVPTVAHSTSADQDQQAVAAHTSLQPAGSANEAAAAAVPPAALPPARNQLLLPPQSGPRTALAECVITLARALGGAPASSTSTFKYAQHPAEVAAFNSSSPSLASTALQHGPSTSEGKYTAQLARQMQPSQSMLTRLRDLSPAAAERSMRRAQKSGQIGTYAQSATVPEPIDQHPQMVEPALQRPRPTHAAHLTVRSAAVEVAVQTGLMCFRKLQWAAAQCAIRKLKNTAMHMRTQRLTGANAVLLLLTEASRP